MSYIFCFLIIESLLFIGAGDGAGVGARAGEKNTRSRSRPKTDRLHNTAVHNTKKRPVFIKVRIQIGPVPVFSLFLDPDPYLNTDPQNKKFAPFTFITFSHAINFVYRYF